MSCQIIVLQVGGWLPLALQTVWIMRDYVILFDFFSRNVIVSVCKYTTGQSCPWNRWAGFIVTDVIIATVCGFNFFFHAWGWKVLRFIPTFPVDGSPRLTQTGCINKFTHKFLIADNGSRWQPPKLNLIFLGTVLSSSNVGTCVHIISKPV